MDSRRLRDAAILLPLGGLLVFLPPYVQIFDQDVTLFGVPLLHVYLFGIWLVGILLTAWLSRGLARGMNPPPAAGKDAAAPEERARPEH